MHGWTDVARADPWMDGRKWVGGMHRWMEHVGMDAYMPGEECRNVWVDGVGMVMVDG